jgi:hypothetical protein
VNRALTLSFNDSRKWGGSTYLDILEANDVPFAFNGQELSFPNISAQERASSIWYDLTGVHQIGVFS